MLLAKMYYHQAMQKRADLTKTYQKLILRLDLSVQVAGREDPAGARIYGDRQVVVPVVLLVLEGVRQFSVHSFICIVRLNLWILNRINDRGFLVSAETVC